MYYHVINISVLGQTPISDLMIQEASERKGACSLRAPTKKQ